MARYSVLKGFYDVEQTIGSGGFAKVKLGTHCLTKEKVAIKIMEKSRLGDDLPRVKIELEALKNLPHQNICKLYQVIETESHYYLILEYCSGGELFDHIVERNRLEEKQARVFFRQIVSAVAFLHDKGYAHRDLKPENVLLDKEKNLKLIDFGLCAKPQPGLDSFLYTSCGSPTYAAPELILGQKYLGSEVDIWSLGILLYALLCGVLPFDDENIDSLYRKILSGRYEESSCLSLESKRLIRSMLQVDPKKRITIDDLLSHPWLMKGFKEPVTKLCLHKVHEKDPSCLSVMAEYYRVSVDVMWSKLNSWTYDYNTATYMLLLSKKQRGLPIKLYNFALRDKMESGFNKLESPLTKKYPLSVTYNKVNSPLMTRCTELKTTYLILNGRESTPDKVLNKELNISDLAVQSLETKDPKSNIEQENSPCVRPTPMTRKPHKRLWSPGPDDTQSPVPSKLKPNSCSGDPQQGFNSSRALEEAVAGAGAETPRCSKVLGSLERRLTRVRHLLTPRRHRTPGAIPAPGATPAPTPGPALLSVKEVCNVSTTSNNNPDTVLGELRKALLKKGIDCKQKKGFRLRGKLHATSDHRRLSFELEVCLVTVPDSSAPPLVGIRRKRLKGDAWFYKRVVEEVLALAKT
ncbi:hypothetical protein R5R35_005544 [Gryllus longicercus]|uniref:non-specific serine/threonine protein kinase n=1 Tax=Gryllus longicercus TaxID=2509291 RepID=A0AAN9ZAL7_9ORTH